ncbi:unnamed protein product [Psylliodes chrysocephalus]|uniref:Uncharacterized protein n=1 Tax=Psylliodes chrysocephalus TaxID=3402493 RepID=A0A9P0GKB9_9CUCU|nr:unnamed protein product [Psylliodes chrysocephala]
MWNYNDMEDSEDCSKEEEEDIFMEYEETNPQDDGNPWLKTIINTYRKYKRELFGDSNTRIRKERSLDYTVRPNYKFVFAKYRDGFYRPGSIVGRNKKLKQFIIYFYHNKKCCYVQPRDIVLKHGNLLDRRVCFSYDGHRRKGTVFGNNSPANRGFPSIFYVKKKCKPKWYKVNFKHIFLTKKQVNRMYFNVSRRRVSSSVCKNRSSRSGMQL